MSDSKSALVKKIGEGNKSLSVIVAEDKLAKFKKFSQSINLSMGYLLNQAIDRYLANNSTEIFNTPTGIPTTPIGNNIHPATPKEDNIEELIKTTIETYLSNKPLDNRLSIGIDEVKDLIKTSIDSIEVEVSIDAKITPLVKSVTKLEDFTQNQLAAMREEIEKLGKQLAIAN